MSLVKIIFDKKNKETHAIFKHVERETVYMLFTHNDRNELDNLTELNDYDRGNIFKFPARSSDGNIQTVEVNHIIHRYARASDTDKYDKYVGAAMLIAEEYAGSKTQLKKDFEGYMDVCRRSSDINSYYSQIEEYAYYYRIPQIYGSIENFKKYIDRHSAEK